MDWSKILKIISDAIYSIGVIIVLLLIALAVFGSNEYRDPTAMIPLTWKQLAIIWLAFGAIPMLLACIAVYKFNDIKISLHKKRNFFLVFLPGFICSGCILYWIGSFVISVLEIYVFHVYR